MRRRPALPIVPKGIRRLAVATPCPACGLTDHATVAIPRLALEALVCPTVIPDDICRLYGTAQGVVAVKGLRCRLS